MTDDGCAVTENGPLVLLKGLCWIAAWFGLLKKYKRTIFVSRQKKIRKYITVEVVRSMLEIPLTSCWQMVMVMVIAVETIMMIEVSLYY